jgi:hypothetical protein
MGGRSVLWKLRLTFDQLNFHFSPLMVLDCSHLNIIYIYIWKNQQNSGKFDWNSEDDGGTVKFQNPEFRPVLSNYRSTYRLSRPGRFIMKIGWFSGLSRPFFSLHLWFLASPTGFASAFDRKKWGKLVFLPSWREEIVYMWIVDQVSPFFIEFEFYPTKREKFYSPIFL